MYKIDYNSYRSVASFGHRVRFLVLHYTAQNFADSVKSLTGKSVSAHYLVPDPSEATYQAAGFSGVRIFNRWTRTSAHGMPVPASGVPVAISTTPRSASRSSNGERRR